LLIGVFYFHEVYAVSVWVGAAVVALGLGFSTWGQLRQP
jgi:hypothetical protein